MERNRKREPFFLCDIQGICRQRGQCEAGFAPRTWRAELVLGWCSGRIELCGRCNNDDRLPNVSYVTPMDAALTGDALLEELYHQMETLRPFEVRTAAGGYTGRLWSRSQWYVWQDKMTLLEKNQQFLDMFPAGQRPTVRRWLETYRPLPDEQRPLLRESIGEMVCAIIEETQACGDMKAADAILDYILPRPEESMDADGDKKLLNYRFDFLPCLSKGGSEGIYIDAYIHGEIDDAGKVVRIRAGTLKTLREDKEGYRVMGELCGLLTYHAGAYLNRNLGRYTPRAFVLTE